MRLHNKAHPTSLQYIRAKLPFFPCIFSILFFSFLHSIFHSSAHSLPSMDPLSSLPPECLHHIFDTLSLENSASTFAALIQTSRYLATVALPYLYRDPYRFFSDGRHHSRLKEKTLTADFLITRIPTRTLLNSLPPSFVHSKILSLAFQPIDPSVLGYEGSCTTTSACETTDTSELPLMDYLAQIRHLHQKPWTIGSDQFMRWTGNRPGVSKFILTREFHDLCNQANLLPILEQDLASVIYGPIYRQHCYQGLFFCEVNWALASSILERLQSLTIPFVDIGRYLEPSSVSRLGRLERVHFNMDSPLHEVTQYPDRPPKETQRMLAIKFAPVVRFVEKHTQLFPGVLKAVSSSQEPLWAPQLLSIVTCCLESIQITISHLLPVLREPRSLTTVPLLLQVLAYPEETDLSRVEEVDICSLKSEEGKAAFAKLRNILQRCRSLRKLRTVSLGAGSFKWAVDERRLAEQQQGQDVLSTAADRLAEERRGTVYRREFRRRGLIRLEEINMSGPIVPVADELRDLMIAFCNTLKSIECICYGASDSRTSRLGNGWVELPALTHLSLGLSTKGSFYDPQLLCHCPNVVSVLLYDKTREYQCEDIKPSLPAQFVRLKSLTLEGMPALSLHPATLHSATKLNNLSLTGKKYGVEEEFYFVAFQGEDNDFTKPYCFIPPKEDIYRSYGIQVDSTYSWTPSVIRPNWTWDWHLPCLVSLTLSSEIAFLFQFRMLQGCPALRALELEIRTFTSSHSRSITDADLFTPTGDQIIAPSLEKLRLHGPWTFTSSSSIAHQFLTGMFPSLVSLSALDWVGLSLRDMVSIVRSMSKPIKELFLESKFALRKDQVELNLFWSNSNYDVEKDVLTTVRLRGNKYVLLREGVPEKP